MRRKPWRSRLPGGVPAVLRSWLREPGSLTARCQSACTEFRVAVVYQGQPAGLPVRDVVLSCDGVPVIFAHSVVSTARGGRLGNWLSRLGNRSLGSLLFSHAGFRRDGIEYARLSVRHPLHRQACEVLGVSLPALWARRSRHHLDDASVLVTEVFLPALCNFEA